ncbi:MAG: deoxyribose-phosphate aldolase [Sedimentisphaerales bacterium]|nr:deoxyribose-phosphate aldolase [Sedimentisphaerales bacterium]
MTDRPMTARELAGCIDHTFLKQEAPHPALEQWCHEAVQYGFATVCVHPCYVARAAELLRASASRVCSVVGFPLGLHRTQIKQQEAALAIEDGARELDMVIHLGAVLQGDLTYVQQDIAPVVALCRQQTPPVILKVILETAALERATKVALCALLSDLGVDFLKTSTGLHPAGGATIEDVRLLWRHRGRCRVKAAGGIRDWQTALAMLAAGAERLGTSSGVQIVTELPT